MSEPAKELITDRRLILQLKALLEGECKLYQEFLNLLAEQRRWITKFKPEKIEELNQQRRRIYRLMQQMHAERLIIMQQFPNSEGKRLTALINEHCTKRDARKLLPIADRLRALVLESREVGSESNQVLSFAMNLVNGSISLLWQATQNVSRSYGRNGKVNEAYTPHTSRDDTVLKEA